MPTEYIFLGKIKISIQKGRVIALCIQGKLRKEMAEILGISISAVDKHTAFLKLKLKVSNPQQLVAEGMKHGYTTNGYFGGRDLFEGFVKPDKPEDK